MTDVQLTRPAGVLATATALIVLATSCGASSPSAPSPTAGSALTGPRLAIYLCPRVSQAPCTEHVTPAQTAAVRRRLGNDHDVARVEYRSERQQYQAAKKRLTKKVTQLLGPGDIPAAFVVSVRSGAGVAAVEARYRHLPGVLLVKVCGADC